MDTTTAQGCVHNYIPIETHIDCELGEPMMVAPRTRRCCSCETESRESCSKKGSCAQGQGKESLRGVDIHATPHS